MATMMAIALYLSIIGIWLIQNIEVFDGSVLKKE